MITDMTVMLYVNNVPAHVDFWEKLGFTEVLRQEVDGFPTSLLTYSDLGAALQLYENAYIEKSQVQLKTAQPVVVFSAPYIDEIYDKAKEIGANKSDITPYGDQYAFTFADPDGNVYTLIGERIDVPLDEENGAAFDRNISEMLPITPAELQELQEPAYIFFGRKTCPWSRYMARTLKDIQRKIYFVDTENTKRDAALRKVRDIYGVVTVPTLIKRASTGMFVKYDKDRQTVEQFFGGN